MPVTVQIDTNARIARIRMEDQLTTPATPSSGHSYLFTKANGLYWLDDAGNVTGPMIDTAVSGSGGIAAGFVYNAAFGDANPVDFYTLPAATEVDEIRLVVTQTWNGSGAAVQIGVSGTPGLYFGSSDSDLTELGIYSKTFNHTNSPLRLTITPGGGASQGTIQIQVLTLPT